MHLRCHGETHWSQTATDEIFLGSKKFLGLGQPLLTYRHSSTTAGAKIGVASPEPQPVGLRKHMQARKPMRMGNIFNFHPDPVVDRLVQVKPGAQ